LWSRRAERAGKAAGGEAKQQAGIVDLGMAAVKTAVVSGERKAVASIRSHSGSTLRRALRHRSSRWRKRRLGSREAVRPALSNAALRAVHAGGGRSWARSPTRAHSVRAWHSALPDVSPFAPPARFLPSRLHSSGRHLLTAPIEANAWRRPFALPQRLFLLRTTAAESTVLACRFGVPPDYQATRSAFGLLLPRPVCSRDGRNQHPRPVAARVIRLPRIPLELLLPSGVLPPRDRCAQPD
jgi:hypothetical protein